MEQEELFVKKEALVVILILKVLGPQIVEALPAPRGRGVGNHMIYQGGTSRAPTGFFRGIDQTTATR